ncbi:hypothetical protein OIU76_017892 [Salix suchowensis]|nr:hypothetical protein OIU76_017892 [Salix suchowensis]
MGETTFTVKLHGPKIAQQTIMPRAIICKDGNGHEVRSPEFVYDILPGYEHGIPSSSMAAQKTDKFGGPSVGTRPLMIFHVDVLCCFN